MSCPNRCRRPCAVCLPYCQMSLSLSSMQLQAPRLAVSVGQAEDRRYLRHDACAPGCVRVTALRHSTASTVSVLSSPLRPATSFSFLAAVSLGPQYSFPPQASHWSGSSSAVMNRADILRLVCYWWWPCSSCGLGSTARFTASLVPRNRRLAGDQRLVSG
jgi:hypothetical protein